MIGERMRRGTGESCDKKEEGERERWGGGGVRAVIERREREMGVGGMRAVIERREREMGVGGG